VIIGGGPAAFGLLTNSFKNGRLTEMVGDNSIAILERGVGFGGGMLREFGINSNTSGDGFLKCVT
jgi:hypothetical protein